MPVFGIAPAEAEAFNHALTEVKNVLRHVNGYLAEGGKTHLVGNRLTVADIYLALPLIMLF